MSDVSQAPASPSISLMDHQVLACPSNTGCSKWRLNLGLNPTNAFRWGLSLNVIAYALLLAIRLHHYRHVMAKQLCAMHLKFGWLWLSQQFHQVQK